MSLTVTVTQSDVAAVAADVLLLKYARGFHGADEIVAQRLISGGACRDNDISPDIGTAALVHSRGTLAADRVLYLGTAGLRGFRYKEMRQFARLAIETLAARTPQATTLALTVHGANYGLDIEESFRSLVMGLQQGLATHPLPCLSQITFVERNSRRFEILSRLAEDVELVRSAVNVPLQKPEPEPRRACVFVAMPFTEEFEDVYQFGIYQTVRKCGYICEKVDEAAYAGSIIDRITDGIENAAFVIADLSLERPNVYLEVGFAWGLKKPVLLIAKDGQRLHFDLAHHKCLFYSRIGRLAEALERTILSLFGPGNADDRPR